MDLRFKFLLNKIFNGKKHFPLHDGGNRFKEPVINDLISEGYFKFENPADDQPGPVPITL